MAKIKRLAIIQARVSSRRLPGKVLKEVCGKPLLELLAERVSRSKTIDHLIVATSSDSSDDAIKILCDRIQIPCYRGNLQNVLDRFYQAALLFQPQTVIRLTGDCPLIDPQIIDNIVLFYEKNNFDYASNTIKPTFPDGLDCEVFKYTALQKAWEESRLPSHQEHVTPFIWQHPERFRLGSFENKDDFSALRWTVDESEDFEFVRLVYEAFYNDDPLFGMGDILSFIQKFPELKEINAGFKRNEGFKLSLATDRLRILGEKCQDVQLRAKERIPGMCQLLSKRPDMFSLGVWPTYFEKASGVDIWDLDGNRYVDMSIGGIGANVLGYCDPEIDAAVIQAIQKGNSTSLNCREEVELAEKMCELHPWAEKVRFARTGGESMAIAVRIARAHTGRNKVAFCGYHGWHDWYLAANLGTKDALGGHLISGLEPCGVPEQLKDTAFPFHYNKPDELLDIVKRHGDDLAAIVMEPIRNQKPTEDFLKVIHEVSNKIGAVLIIDEISAGFRLCSGGAHLILGLHPDIAVFSKALGNGYPIAAIIGKGEIMDAAQKTFISSTYWTERTGFVAALAMIKKFSENRVHEHLIKIGEAVHEGWSQVAQAHGINLVISGMAPLGHFDFQVKNALVMKAYFVQEMLKKGFLATNLFYSMFAHRQEHVVAYLESMHEVFEKMSDLDRKNQLESALDGMPARTGFRRMN